VLTDAENRCIIGFYSLKQGASIMVKFKVKIITEAELKALESIAKVVTITDGIECDIIAYINTDNCRYYDAVIRLKKDYSDCRSSCVYIKKELGEMSLGLAYTIEV
jgi:hypothetical protein